MQHSGESVAALTRVDIGPEHRSRAGVHRYHAVQNVWDAVVLLVVVNEIDVVLVRQVVIQANRRQLVARLALRLIAEGLAVVIVVAGDILRHHAA